MKKTHASARRATREAFTLVEFIVVATIIGILAALIVPRFFGEIGQAKTAVATQKIGVLEVKVIQFQKDCGRLPTNQEGIRALIEEPPGLEGKWKGPYVKRKDIVDPWDVEFRYASPGRYNQDFDIFTFGADGKEGGEDDNTDVGNW